MIELLLKLAAVAVSIGAIVKTSDLPGIYATVRGRVFIVTHTITEAVGGIPAIGRKRRRF